MRPGRRFLDALLRVVYVPALLICFSMPLLSQETTGQQKPVVQVPPAPPGPANDEIQGSCPAISSSEIPIKTTIEAKVTGGLEARRQKAGKKLWVNSIYEMDFPGCRMIVGAPIYGTVTAASSLKDGGKSELSLEFNAADCVGRDKKPMKLIVMAVAAPPGEQAMAHDATPTEVQGGARNIGDTVASRSGYDAKLNPAEPTFLRPGSVLGFKSLKLDPQGGPRCSARITSTDRDLVLPPGTILLLALRSDE